MKNKIINAGDLWCDIMMLPHNGDMVSSEEVEEAIIDAPEVSIVKQEWVNVLDKLPTENDALFGKVVAIEKYGRPQITWWDIVVKYKNDFVYWLPLPKLNEMKMNEF